MAWLLRAVAVMPHRTATMVSWMLTSIACQLRLTMVSADKLPPRDLLSIMLNATPARMEHGNRLRELYRPLRQRLRPPCPLPLHLPLPPNLVDRAGGGRRPTYNQCTR